MSKHRRDRLSSKEPSFPRRPSQRQEVLVRRRHLKMARSAHAYVRGSTAKFYEWLASGERASFPDGPTIWICGDCHVGNLGPVADSKGRVQIQIRDLDQTVIGNPAHDLIRLALSLATAARGSDLPGVTTAHMIERLVLGYEAEIQPRRGQEKPPRPPKAVAAALGKALKRSWEHLLRERVEDTEPEIPIGERFWPLTNPERHALSQLVKSEAARQLLTILRVRDDHAKTKLLDAAYWMKGCSSLGRLRFAALVGVGKGSVEEGGLSLIDIKEAVAADAPRVRSAPMPKHNAERVVEGARHLSPALGQRMLATQLLGRSVFVRELLPQDLKLEIERLRPEEATGVAEFLAGVVGRAHAGQMDDPTRRKWAAELRRHHPKSLEAPSWLWASVVELMATHEAAYLEHCRRYAMNDDLNARWLN